MLFGRDSWWHNLPLLREKTEAVYEKVGHDIWQTTAEKMIELRGWTKAVTPAMLIPVLQELQTYYVPKKLFPGPMFIFPEYDAAGRLTRAQTKPLHDLLGEGKYHTLGVKKDQFLGPVWYGNSDAVLARILATKTVVLVEGPFDLIAAKMASPGLPLMSSLTKSIGEQHVAYLRILGVQRVCPFFDNEESEAGRRSMLILQKTLPFQVDDIGLCPGGDPSAAMQTTQLKVRLKRVLSTVMDE